MFSTFLTNSNLDLPGKIQDQSIPCGTLSELTCEMYWPSELGTTLVYVPTRKETVKIAAFLCKYGVKAAPYHAAVCTTN